MPNDKTVTTPAVRMTGTSMGPYIFIDRRHAVDWFNQGFCAKDKEYRDSITVEIGTKSNSPCSECGQPRTKFEAKKTMTVDEFLKQESQRAANVE